MASKKPVNGWDPDWLRAHAPAGTFGPAKGVQRTTALPPPPVGTYDPSIDYNAGAAQRGFGYAQDDAQTQYEQGQEDYNNALTNLQNNTNQTLADLLTGNTRSNQDYATATSDLGHQYGVLGHQQAEHAAQQGVTSAGLLAQSNAIRGANQAHDQSALDTTHTRANEDYATNVGRTNEAYNTNANQLSLQNARTFGGYGGNTLTDPYTGQPVAGSLLTNLTRAGTENNAYQTAAGQQRIYGAQAGGYVAPTNVGVADAASRIRKLLGLS